MGTIQPPGDGTSISRCPEGRRGASTPRDRPPQCEGEILAAAAMRMREADHRPKPSLRWTEVERWIAAAIAGRLDTGARPAHEDVVAVARSERVVGLLHREMAHLSNRSEWHVQLGELLSEWARQQAAFRLAIDMQTARIVSLARSRRLDVIVLKGAALGHWLYAEPYLRESGDLDILISGRSGLDEFMQTVGELGWRADGLRPRSFQFELVARRLDAGGSAASGVELDVHWALINAPVFASRLDFEALLNRASRVPIAGIDVHVLSPVDAMLHACMNRIIDVTNDGRDKIRSLLDIRLMGMRLDGDSAIDLVNRAAKSGLAGTVLLGLRAADNLFGGQTDDSVLGRLEACASREALDANRLEEWRYLQGRNLAALANWWDRLRWLRYRVAPGPRALAALYGGEGQASPIYLKRLGRLLSRLRSMD